VSVLKGEESPLAEDDARLLLAVPADRWIRAEEGGDPATVRDLAARGLLVTDGGDEELFELRRRDEQLASPAWNRYAALYHALTRWSDVRAAVAGEAPLPAKSGRWPPPPHFHSAPDPLSVSPASPDRAGCAAVRPPA